MRCWDERAFERAPGGAFKAVSCGNWHCCAIKVEDTLACWGNDEDGRASPPAGQFSAVMAAVEHSCAVRAEGGVVCWGSNHLGQCNVPQREGEHNWYVPGL
ncbi:hypothetical protein [Nannocystis pusilla]|uniref:non-specific serine/threonine protein kinase n=1 Tax=Nannocystis pusilla TaxID=889268 RepID=A0ABS7TNC0_9BACT|nr:hypothetical protein [Nannocystis pusilla]MBZ5709724.1 hypothetical protein [Nannocystis pusilla]